LIFAAVTTDQQE